MIRLRRDSLHSTFMVSMMMFAVLSAGCIVYLWLSHEYRNFNREMAALRHEFTMERKAASRSEVNRVFDYIEYQRSSTNRKLREMLRSRVYEATAMAEGIFNMYRDRKPPDEIGVMIREALRDVRFNDGRGYYFIYDMQGRNILLPFSPELEGRNLWDLQDSQGLYTIRRFVRIVREQGEGFLDWYWYKPGTREHMARKTGFARYFAPLDWWIGTGEYEADFEKDIQRDILDWIGKIRFGEDGYIFVHTDRGVNLAHAIPEYVGKNQWEMTDPEGLKMIQSLIHSAREPDGGYTSYIWKRPSTGKPGHKIGYTRMFDPWKWVIGTGDYINSIEDRIALKQSGIREKIRLLMYRIVTMLTILLIIIFFVARYVSGKLVQNFTVFSDFFEKATEHSSRIDDAAVHFTEFRYLARCANRMIEQQALFQEALRESEERLNLTIRSTGQVLWDWDIATGKIVWDSQIANLFEYSISEMTSLADWYSRVHPDDRPVLEKARSAHISGETVFFEAEYRIQGSGGQWKWVLDQGKVIRWDMSGHALRAVGTCMDITARKQAEQEKAKLQEQLDRSRKMEALGLLAGGVAHDLNNVLSGIVGYPELILMDLPPDSPIRAPVSAIAQSGQRAAAIVQDLLTLARRGVVQKETLSLNAVISEYLASPECRKLVTDHPGLVIRQNLLPELFNIKGSPVHLKKTVMNLVMNAAEAQPNGGEVLITTENRYVDKPLRGYDTIQEGDFAVIRIEDQGVGISSDDLKRIFEPFYTRKIMGRSGTGLGMAVVWGTVQDHGGYINVDSTPGQGTVFELYFRAVREDVATAGPPDSPDRYRGNGEILLVVDDIRQQRHIASHMLERLGYQVHTAAGGEEALEWLKMQTADLLILDMIMDPGMDGLETYRESLHIHPEQKAIIASGFAETDRVREAQRLGAGAYIRKPYTLEELGKAVKAELERHDKKTIKPELHI